MKNKNLHIFSIGKKFILALLLMTFSFAVNAQNMALTATATHSGGGATIYDASNYNDNVIASCGSTPWGWVSTNGWIEYTWTTPQTINKVVFFKDNRPMTTCTIQYWTGTAYATATTYNSSVSCLDSISFNAVTTTKLRFNNVSGNSNPNHREIQVYGITCSTQVTQNPVVQTTLCENQNTSFSIAAQDVTAYKWQVNEGSGYIDVVNGVKYTGAATASLGINQVPFGFNGNKYRCIASKGTSAACADTSNEANLTVNGLVKLDDLKPRDTTCINATKDLEVKSSGSITNYKWQMFRTGIGYIDVPVAAPYVHMGHMLTINGVPDTLDGTRFRCVVDGVCDTRTSSELLLTVSLIPTVAVPPADVNTTQGNSVIFEVQASGAGARYQWQVAPSDTFVNINDGGIYLGAKSNKLTVYGVSRVQDGFKFRCVVRSGPQCNAPGDTSEFAVLYVAPPASVGALDDDGLVVLYPNPTGINELYIKTNNSLNGQELKYKVVDKTGRTVMVGNMNGTDKTRVDVARLAADIYLVEIVDAANNVVAKSRFTKL